MSGYVCSIQAMQPMQTNAGGRNQCKPRSGQAQAGTDARLHQALQTKVPGHFPAHIQPFGAFYAANSIKNRAGLD